MATSDPPLVAVAAGGTGGHLFPAEALAAALASHGVAVDLVTDERAARYGREFPARQIHVVPSATFRKSNPLTFLTAPAQLALGTARASNLFKQRKPAAVIGFGGYPTVPPVVAGRLNGIPTLIHEQNAVMGRANRLLAPIVRVIATGFPGILADQPRLAAKATHTGNPIRAAVLAAAKEPYADPEPGGQIRLLVFGGSQGARVMADVVPPAVELMPIAMRNRLSVVQQARDEDFLRVNELYARLGIAAEVAPFFADLPARMAASHLVIARAGASTVAELAAIGRPGILVPLPHALDQDQRANAGILQRAGAAIRIDQQDFTPSRLANEIAGLVSKPERLKTMADAARRNGTLDAAERLAALVLQTAGLPAR